MPLTVFTTEEILYHSVAILVIVAFGSGFARFFAASFAASGVEGEVNLDINPFTNLDVIGTLVFFLGGFGWGRQPDDRRIRFTNQRLGWLVIALIAPFSSLTLALSAAYIKHYFWTDRVVEVLIQMCVATTAYHIVPIPPLAGGRLFHLVFPHESTWRMLSLAGPFILLALVAADRFAGFAFLRETMQPVVDILNTFVNY